MQKKFEIDTYAVIGNPIAHSKSPIIHTEFAKQTHQSLQYLKILVPLDGFNEAVKNFQQRGGKGLNVTAPFKRQAWQLVKHRSPTAQITETVNTIIFQGNGESAGDSTDGVGLIRDITINENYSIAGKTLLFLGAGGAVQAIIPSLFAAKVKEIFIANRTSEKAIALAQRFSKLGSISGGGFNELSGKFFDIIVNGTSTSLIEKLPPLPTSIITVKTFCYDLVYGDKPTVFLRWAKQSGAAKCLDGLGMLVEQAAETFYIWRNVRPETQPVIKLLRDTITEK